MSDAILSPSNRLRHLNYSFRRSGKIYQWTLSLCSFHSRLKVKLSSKFITFFSKGSQGSLYTSDPKGKCAIWLKILVSPCACRKVRAFRPRLHLYKRESFSQARTSLVPDSPPSHYEVGSCVWCNDKSWVSLILHAALPLRPLIPIDVSWSSVHRMCLSESRDIDHPSAHIAMTPTASNLF